MYRGPVTLFTASARWDQTGDAATDRTLGWAPWIDGPIDVHEVPATHVEMLAQPHATAMAERLRALLGAAAPRTGGGGSFHHPVHQSG